MGQYVDKIFQFITSYIFVCASALLLISQTLAAGDMIVDTDGSTLALRAGPNKDTSLICDLPKDTRVTTTEETGRRWVKVSVLSQSHSHCGSGWVWGGYLKDVTNNTTEGNSNSSGNDDGSDATSSQSAASPIEPIELSMPICGCESCSMTSGYGWRTLRKRANLHFGHDYDGPSGTEVVAMADGEVVYSRGGCSPTDQDCHGGLGNHVVLKIDSPVKDRNGTTYQPPVFIHYAHLQNTGLPGKGRVKRGETLGHLGNTGSSTGPHLDIKITDRERYDGVTYKDEEDTRKQLEVLQNLLLVIEEQSTLQEKQSRLQEALETLRRREFAQIRNLKVYQPLKGDLESVNELEAALKSAKDNIRSVLRGQRTPPYRPSLFLMSNYTYEGTSADEDKSKVKIYIDKQLKGSSCQLSSIDQQDGAGESESVQ